VLRLSIRRPVGRKPTCPVDSPSRLRESTPERVSTITGRSRAGARSVVDRHVTSQVAPFVSISSHCVEPAQIDRTSPLPSPPQPTLDSTIQFNRVVSTLIKFTATPPSRLHRCKRPSKLSTLCKCTVIPIGWLFYVQPIAAECWRGRTGRLSRILGKNTIFNEHPVVFFVFSNRDEFGVHECAQKTLYEQVYTSIRTHSNPAVCHNIC